MNGRERPALFGQGDAGSHGVIAHELHHLAGELLPLLRAVAHAERVHQVGQAHNAQPDAPHAVRCLLQLGHGGHVGIDADHVIEEARGQRHRLGQPVPVHAPVCDEMLGQVDAA